jgi:N-acetylneuraminate synthase
MKTQTLVINGRKVGPGHPVYTVAEMSANHNQDFKKAVKIIEAAKEAGADAIKLQTYTPDTITIDVRNEYFQVKGTIWEGKNLYDLYGEAYTPWDWQPKLNEIAAQLELDLFSTPFDSTAVDFLEKMGVPAYKVASFEVVDIPLLRKIARTGKPVIMSTGMATLSEIEEAVNALRGAGGDQLALLKCTSAYPAPIEEMNLRTIPHLANAFDVPAGVSDHTMSLAVPVAAVTLGACIVEKHFTLSRNDAGPDTSFSMEPDEFKEMVEAIRTVERALGRIQYGVTDRERESRVYRRSLFVVEDVRTGEIYNEDNVKCIRPAYGLHPRNLHKVLGRKAKKDLKRGTPLSWDAVE